SASMPWRPARSGRHSSLRPSTRRRLPNSALANRSSVRGNPMRSRPATSSSPARTAPTSPARCSTPMAGRSSTGSGRLVRRPVAVHDRHQAHERLEAIPAFASRQGPPGFGYGRKAGEDQAIEDGAVRHAFGPDAALDTEQVLETLFGEPGAGFELIGLLR